MNSNHSMAGEQPSPAVSVIVVSYNTREILRLCLQRLSEELTGIRAQVIVVDNDSRDQSAEMVELAFPQFELLRSSSNLGFAAANNLGFSHASAPYIILLNPDAFLGQGAIRKALAHIESMPQVGIAGGRLQDQQGKLQPSGRLFPSLINELLSLSGLAARFPQSRLFGRFDRTWADPEQDARVDWVPGAFTIIRQSALKAAGRFDERFFLYYEEVDLCRRVAQAGYQIWYWPEIRVTHLGGESSKTVTTLAFSSAGSQLTLWRMRSALLYYRKHHGKLIAWLCARLEIGWNQLRLFKRSTLAAAARDPQLNQQLSRDVALMQRAWRETSGGAVSPQRPW